MSDARLVGPASPLPDAPVHALFQAQVAQRPDAVALVSGDEHVSYSDLDRRANRLACRLVERGVRRGDLVGVLLGRGVDLVVALLAVLKSGAGYVPLDPDLPDERLRLMVARCAIRHVVRGTAPLGWGTGGGPVEEVPVHVEGGSGAPPAVEVVLDDPACVLFTSGSTGTPKAVLSDHRSTVRTFFGQAFADYGPDVVLLQCAPISWDIHSLELWPALLHGGTSVLAPPGWLDLDTIAALAARHRVTVLSLSAGLFNAAVDEVPEVFSGLRQAITHGDAASPGKLAELRERFPGLRLTNGYGPVESMVYATAHDLTDDDLAKRVAPIGTPLANTSVVVLDAAGEPVRPGEVGELLIGGHGLALGYLGAPGATAERFVPDPFGPPGTRLYRTGDLVRFGDSGVLEYLGRNDDQRKLRGFRVEPGEVAATIETHPRVLRATAVVRDDIAGGPALVGYAVADNGKVTEAELLEFLAQRLPEHLVPSAVVLLDALPLRPSGKVDRTALPAVRPAPTPHVEPRTEVERELADIWAQVLGVDRVGVHDDFFTLGGDSILIMRVTARARRRGLRLTPRDFFAGRTVARLALAVRSEPEREPVPHEDTAAPLPLTPIQRWFFDQDRSNPHHFNQSVLVTLDGQVDAAALRTALAELVTRHDALRLRFWRDGTGEWRQQLAAAEDIVAVPLEVVDLAGLGPHAVGEAVHDRTRAAEAGLRIDQPPLLRAVLFDQGAAGAELLLVAHHLAVDTVSWAILVEDLEALHEAAVTGRPAQLLRTTSFARWAREGRAAPLPPAPRRSAGSAARGTSVRLDADETARLVTAGAHEVLLAALGHALTAVGGPAHRTVDVESHGRDHGADEFDLLRTVGWFTRVEPFTLPAAEGPREHLREVRARLAAGGGAEPGTAEREVSFNYLGRVDAGVGSGWSWRPRVGVNTDPQDAPVHPLAVVAHIADGRLTVDFTYDTAVHEPAAVERLAAEFTTALHRLGAGGPAGLELTPAQAGIVFATWRGGPGTYLEQRVWRMSDEEADAAVRGWRRLFARHEALRTGIRRDRGGAPTQFFADEVDLPVAVVDLTGATDPERGFADFLRRDRAAGFDLGAPPLARLAVVRTDRAEVRLVFTHHHLLLDGWSYGVLLNELTSPDDPGEPAPPFSRYVAWLRDQPTEPALAHWRERLAGARPTPVTRPVAPGRGGRGHREYLLPVEPGVVDALRKLTGRHGLTLSSLVHGCWALAVAARTGRSDVVFASTYAVRPDEIPDVDRMVGPMIGTAPVRVALPPEMSALTWLHGVQERLLDLREQPPLPLGAVTATAGLPSGEVLCDSVVVFENFSAGRRAGDATDGVNSVSGAVLPALSQPDFPLTVIAKPATDGLGLKLIYEPAAVDDADVRLLAELLAHLLGEVARDPDRPLGVIPLRCPDGGAAADDAELPARSVVELFRARTAAAPDATALTFTGGRWTYADLAGRVDGLTSHLRAAGVTAGTVVGVCLDRSPELVVAVLSVLAAGGAFLPLDRREPPARLAFMADDAGASLVVTASDVDVDWPGAVTPVVLDRLGPAPAGAGGGDPRADDPAYVIYTSGSTGRPKGVLLRHGGLVNRLAWMARECELGPRDVVLQKTPFGFDVAVWELLWPLAFGACLHVAEPLVERDHVRLTRVIDESGCTVLHFVPSALDAYLPSVGRTFDRVRLVVTSGEALTPAVAEATRAAFPGARRHNLYGPTEATIDVTAWPLPDATPASVPIGRPIPGHRAHVVDPWGREVPDGFAGELVVTGIGVAVGYVGRAALTAERFVPDPWSPSGSRLYRTGDLVRRRADGVLEYLGRIDRQVKIRGFRVECGEVEAAVAALPGVAAAAVVASADPAGGRRLVAFVTPAAGRRPGDLVAARLRDSLRERVPDHLVPALFVPLDALPLKANGKVDHDALPVPDDASPGARWVAPRTRREEVLAGIWAEVLGVPEVGVDDDFFDLGGHSLAAMRIAGLAGQALGVDVPAAAAFDWPTVARMAAGLADLAAEDPPTRVPDDVEVPASYAQRGMWLVDQLSPGDPFYNVPTAFRLRGELDTNAIWQAVNGLVARHEALRTRFVAVDGQPVPVVEEIAGIGLSVESAHGPDPVERARQLALAELARPFDLGQAPLLRGRLVRLAPDDHVLVLVSHHIASDAWSKAVVARELWVLYNAAVLGTPPDLPALPLRYRDFAVWQHARVDGPVGRRQLRHWAARMAGAPTDPAVPATRPEPDGVGHGGDVVRFDLGADVVAALDRVAADRSATLFMLLLAALQALLARWTERTDVVVGTPVAGRPAPELHGVVGMFVNTLPIRTDVGGDPRFTELVDQVRRTVVDAFANQDLPFERLVRELVPDRSVGRNPLVSILFQVIGQSWGVPEAPDPVGLRLEPFELEVPTARFDLVVDVRREPDGGMRGRITYAVDVHDRAVVEALAAAWRLLLEQAGRHPSWSVSALTTAPVALLRTDRPAEPPGAGEPDDDAVAAGIDLGAGAPEVEDVLAGMWCELLEVDRVGPDDDFFRLGGHSLVAARLCARIEVAFGVRLPLAAVFTNRRLRPLAGVVAEHRRTGAVEPPLRPRQR